MGLLVFLLLSCPILHHLLQRYPDSCHSFFHFLGHRSRYSHDGTTYDLGLLRGGGGLHIIVYCLEVYIMGSAGR
jgi:hypothetical protein